MDTTDKVSLLSNITTKLNNQVEEVKVKQILSTHPEVIEVHKKTTFEAVDRIKEGEKLCKEAIDKVSVTWELLPEDEKAEKIIEDLWQTKLQ